MWSKGRNPHLFRFNHPQTAARISKLLLLSSTAVPSPERELSFGVAPAVDPRRSDAALICNIFWVEGYLFSLTRIPFTGVHLFLNSEGTLGLRSKQ